MGRVDMLEVGVGNAVGTKTSELASRMLWLWDSLLRTRWMIRLPSDVVDYVLLGSVVAGISFTTSGILTLLARSFALCSQMDIELAPPGFQWWHEQRAVDKYIGFGAMGFVCCLSGTAIRVVL